MSEGMGQFNVDGPFQRINKRLRDLEEFRDEVTREVLELRDTLDKAMAQSKAESKAFRDRVDRVIEPLARALESITHPPEFDPRGL